MLVPLLSVLDLSDPESMTDGSIRSICCYISLMLSSMRLSYFLKGMNGSAREEPERAPDGRAISFMIDISSYNIRLLRKSFTVMAETSSEGYSSTKRVSQREQTGREKSTIRVNCENPATCVRSSTRSPP